MRRSALPVLLACALQACGEKKPEVEPTHRGVYLGGDQLNSFVPCGGKEMYWVVGKASFGLQSTYRTLARRPFQPIYVELLAGVAAPDGQALMEAHGGNLRVDSVLKAQGVVPATCKMPPPEE